jgi:hypothetical protein
LAGFLRSRIPGAGRGEHSQGAEEGSMNLAHTGTLGKLARASDLRKDGTRQSDNLSGRAALALQSVRLLIVENPKDASLRQLVDSFRRALQDYDAGIDKDPVTNTKAHASVGKSWRRSCLRMSRARFGRLI